MNFFKKFIRKIKFIFHGYEIGTLVDIEYNCCLAHSYNEKKSSQRGIIIEKESIEDILNHSAKVNTKLRVPKYTILLLNGKIRKILEDHIKFTDEN